MAILLAKMAIIGQSRQNEFLKPKTIGINTKVKSLACSNQKLPINGHLATPVILRGMKVISMNFSFQKIGNRHQNQVSSMFRFKVTNLAILF